MTTVVAFVAGVALSLAYSEVSRRGERRRLELDLQVERQRVESMLERLQTRSVQEFHRLPHVDTANVAHPTPGRWVHSLDGLQSVFVSEMDE